MNKYIVGAVLTVGILVSPLFASAASLTASQIQSVLGLLTAFGADATTIANVQASLIGSAPVTPTTSTPASAGSARVVSTVGTTPAGSSLCSVTNSTDIKVFQAKNGISQTGSVGPITRAKLNALYGCNKTVATACVRSGCSNQLCVEVGKASSTVSTCEYRAEYACYNAARCEVQATGTCGWTQTSELTSCISNKAGTTL